MSKSFGKTTRRAPATEKGGSDDKRPSVFERLGVRSRENPNSSSYNQSSETYGGSQRRPEGKPARHHGAGKESKSRGADSSNRRSRSASYSPPTKAHRKFDDNSASHTSKSSKVKDMTAAGGGSRHGVKKGIKDLEKHKPLKEESKHQHSAKKDKDKKRAVKKVVEKKKRKGRSSSASSGDSSEADSYSSSSSRSSSTSSSSSSNNSSSSESSVPSIKLKSEKPKAKKKKSKPEKGIPVPKAPSTSRSSSSGREANAKRSAIDLREKLNARSPSGMKEQYHPSSSGGRKDELPLKRSKAYERTIQDDRHTPKKRSVPQESFIPDDVKRRRLLSPPQSDKYRPPAENPPHLPRRAPPQMHDASKRGRSPGFPKDQARSTHSPMRRPRVDEPRRPTEFRNEVDKRSPAAALVRAPGFNPNMKPREFDRFREPDYRREGHQPRERVAPSRTPSDNRQEREREAPTDYQRRPRPFVPPPDSNRGRGMGFRSQNMDKERSTPRFGGRGARIGDEPRHVPLIPKSKEALAERYEQMKKSGYVDKWVDETVKTVQRPVEDAELERIVPPAIAAGKSPVVPIDKVLEKPKPLETKEMIETAIVETEILSDVSDDDDGFINNEDSVLDSVPPNETLAVAESESVQKKGLGEKTPVAEIVIKPPMVEKTPSIASQDRTLKTPCVPEGSGRSLRSQSQTDDDILETMDFEEISEDELGEVENKVHIVDALGVDWASLVCQEKKSEPEAAVRDSFSSSVRKRWNPLRMLSRVGVSKDLLGEKLYNRIMDSQKKLDSSDQKESGTMNQPSHSRCVDILDKIGLGPNSRALSSRRDLAVRRYFLGLPQKSILSLDLIHQSSSNVPPPEMESAELYKLSISLFKPLKDSTVAVSS